MPGAMESAFRKWSRKWAYEIYVGGIIGLIAIGITYFGIKSMG